MNTAVSKGGHAQDSLAAIEQLSDSIVGEERDTAVADSAIPGAKDTTTVAVVKNDSLHFTLNCLKDSTWAYVYVDGQKWFTHMVRGMSKSFSAKDSFNIYVEDNAHFTYVVNGKPQTIESTSFTAFRIDAKETKIIKSAEFKNIFKGRL